MPFYIFLLINKQCFLEKFTNLAYLLITFHRNSQKNSIFAIIIKITNGHVRAISLILVRLTIDSYFVDYEIDQMEE